MSPQELTAAATALRPCAMSLSPGGGRGQAMDADRSHDLAPRGHVSSDSDMDDYDGDGEVEFSREEALRLLGKTRNPQTQNLLAPRPPQVGGQEETTPQSRTHKKRPPGGGGRTLQEGPSKRPCLARQSEFLEWNNSDSDSGDEASLRLEPALTSGASGSHGHALARRGKMRQFFDSDEEESDGHSSVNGSGTGDAQGTTPPQMLKETAETLADLVTSDEDDEGRLVICYSDD